MPDTTNPASFSADQKRILACVLDQLIPADPQRRLPAAGEVGVADYIETTLHGLPDLWSLIVQGLADLEAAARQRFACSFEALGRDEKHSLLQEQGFVFPLTFHTYIGYYQHSTVASALGMRTGAPHPQGYDMRKDDLSLLDVVRRRPRLYRN